LTFFPREGMFSALYLSLPGGQGVCILYARVVFALSTTKKRSSFCRDSDLPSYRFKCLLRAACVSLLMMKMQSKNETHVQTNVQTNRRSLFYRFRVFSARL
jgi:hypothetical protein